jgi:hypothetical protein
MTLLRTGRSLAKHNPLADSGVFSHLFRIIEIFAPRIATGIAITEPPGGNAAFRRGVLSGKGFETKTKIVST